VSTLDVVRANTFIGKVQVTWAIVQILVHFNVFFCLFF
jgi:hypothetical protein